MNGSTWQWRKLRRRVLERDHYRCRWCGNHATEVDHLTPLAEGGRRYDPANLVASCTPCNRRRGGSLGRQRQLARWGQTAKTGPRRTWPGAINVEEGPWPP